MWKKLLRKDKFWLISLVITWLITQFFYYIPSLTQLVYTNFLFVYASRLLHFSLGWVPFSIGDLGYVVVGVILIRHLWKLKKTHSFKKSRFWVRLIVAIVPFYVLFQWMWGFNYYKLPLHQQLEIPYQYTTEELFQFTEKVLYKTNSLQLTLASNDSLPVEYSMNFDILKDDVYKAFASLEGDTTLQLLPRTRNLKKSIISGPLTYMGFAGYINPFTNEAQINSWMPASKWYITSTHEIAHQLGYAMENEANFVATYVCTQQEENKLMQYAGFSFALKYCLNELYYRDRDKFEYLYNCIHEGVLLNFRQQNEFWEKYDNALEPIFKLIYGTYLQANNQPDGMETYSYVTALLVNHGLRL
jgi:hypothetical protein